MPTRTRRSAKKTEEYTPLTDDQIIQRIDLYEKLKGDAARAEKAWKEIQAQVIAELNHRGVDQIEWSDGRVKKTQAERVTISVDKLSELVHPRVLRKVTTRVVDKTLLSAAIQEGSISKEAVAAASDVTKNAPYISISHGTGD